NAPSVASARAPANVGVRLPRPSAVRLGIWTLRDASTWPSVSLPESPNAAASGASPTPSPSQTITIARRNGPMVPDLQPTDDRVVCRVGVARPRHARLMTEPRHLALRVAHGFGHDITLGSGEARFSREHGHSLAIADRLQRAGVCRQTR